MSNLFLSLSLCLSSSCRPKHGLYIQYFKPKSASMRIKTSQIIQQVMRKSSLVSHFLLPADLWPCYTSAAPASAAARPPPAPPGAAAVHPNETEKKIEEVKTQTQIKCIHLPHLLHIYCTHFSFFSISIRGKRRLFLFVWKKTAESWLPERAKLIPFNPFLVII